MEKEDSSGFGGGGGKECMKWFSGVIGKWTDETNTMHILGSFDSPFGLMVLNKSDMYVCMWVWACFQA